MFRTSRGRRQAADRPEERADVEPDAQQGGNTSTSQEYSGAPHMNSSYNTKVGTYGSLGLPYPDWRGRQGGKTFFLHLHHGQKEFN